MPFSYSRRTTGQFILATDVDELQQGVETVSHGIWNVMEPVDSAQSGTYARGDGLTDDAAAFALADTNNAGHGVTYAPPTTTSYLIGTSKTLAHALHLPPGALLSIASGVTLTLNGPLDAGPYPIFGGAGTVVLGPGAAPDGVRPEWWGSGAAAWQAAITAAEGTGQGQAKVVGQPGTTYTLASGLTLKRSTIIDLCGATISCASTTATLFTEASVSDGGWQAGGVRNGKLAGSGGTSVAGQVGSGTNNAQGVLWSDLEITGFNDGVAFVGSGGQPFATLFRDVRCHNNLRYGYSWATGVFENAQFEHCYTFNNPGGGYVVLAGSGSVEIRLTGGGVDGNGDGTHPAVYCADTASMDFHAVNTHFECPNAGTPPQLIRSDAGISSGTASIALLDCVVLVSAGIATSPLVQLCYGQLTILGGTVQAGSLATALVQLGDANNKSVWAKIVGVDFACNTPSGSPYYLETVTTAPISYEVLGNKCSGLGALPVATFGANGGSVGKTDMTQILGPTGDLTASGLVTTHQLAVGGGNGVMRGFWTGFTNPLDFGTVAAGGTAERTITIPGYTTGYGCAIATPAGLEAGLVWSAYPVAGAPGGVTIRVANPTAAAVVTAGRFWSVEVIDHT